MTTPQESGGAPFLTGHRRVESEAVYLLPSPSATLVISRDRATPNRFVTPHREVLVVEDAQYCLRLAPHVVKCLLGEPRRHLGESISTAERPTLAPFATLRSLREVSDTLADLRGSLAVTADESDFVTLWRHAGERLPTGDRRVQRLCLRYAGQSPRAVNMTLDLARTLDADNTSGLMNSLGLYADAAHLGRVCRAFTARTPTRWRNMSQTFY